MVCLQDALRVVLPASYPFTRSIIRPVGLKNFGTRQRPRRMRFTGGRRKLLSAEHQAAGEDVMQRLFLLREAGKKIAEEQCQLGNLPAEIPEGSAPEREGMSVEVGDIQPQQSLPRRSLPFGRLEQPVVRPHNHEQQKETRQRQLRDLQSGPATHLMEDHERGGRSRSYQREQEGKDERIDHEGDTPQPESRVEDMRSRRRRGLGERNCLLDRPRFGNSYRAQLRNREGASTLGAETRPLRERCSAILTR
jgi:hypothetical protein